MMILNQLTIMLTYALLIMATHPELFDMGEGTMADPLFHFDFDMLVFVCTNTSRGPSLISICLL